MGTFFRANLFHRVSVEAVYTHLEEFHVQKGHPLRKEGKGYPENRLDLHEVDQDWVCLRLGIGWEWELRRGAYLHVSRELSCPGFFVFVYDSDFWGYEFFHQGDVADHFMQDPNTQSWFPGFPCTGNPELIAGRVPGLDPGEFRPYLIQHPRFDEFPDNIQRWRERDRRDVKARPGDLYTRFHGCAVVDFIRFLGVRAEFSPTEGIRFLAPMAMSFWIG